MLNQADILESVDWDDLIDTLDAEKCILFIGSGVYEAPGGGNFEQAFRQWMDIDNPNHPHIRMLSDDGFLLLHKNKYKRQVLHRMREFFNQPFPETEALLARLAALPFSTILTLSNDNLLTRSFDAEGYPYHWDLYFRNRPVGTHFEFPTKNKPLIYSFLGNLEEPESTLLTHNDFFDYLKSIFEGNSMHPEIRETLENAERYIFLGLPYEKWYFQLMLRVFSMHSDRLKEIERLALKEFENPSLHTIYEEEFKIEFFPADIKPFVEELYRRCGEKGILKSRQVADARLAALPDLNEHEFRNLVANADMRAALDHLQARLERQKPRSIGHLNQLTMLKNRFNLLEKRQLMGTIDERDASVDRQQVVEKTLELLGQVFQV